MIAPIAAIAQSDPMDADLCGRLVAHIQTMSPMAIQVEGHQVEELACVATGVVVDFPGNYEPDIRLRRVAITGQGFERHLDDLTPLQAVTVDIDDLQMLPQTGDPTFDYMLEVQQARNLIDVDISVVWDPETLVLTLEQFDIDFPYDNAVSATMQVANVDLSSLGALELSLGGMAVTEATLEVTSNGLFENYGATMLIPLVLSGTMEPEAEVEAMKASAVAVIAKLPSAFFVGDTPEALAAIVADMPTPGGTVDLRLTAEPGLGALRFGSVWLGTAPQSLADFWTYLHGVEVDVTYERVPIE
jgi:hypothetical protein